MPESSPSPSLLAYIPPLTERLTHAVDMPNPACIQPIPSQGGLPATPVHSLFQHGLRHTPILKKR